MRASAQKAAARGSGPADRRSLRAPSLAETTRMTAVVGPTADRAARYRQSPSSRSPGRTQPGELEELERDRIPLPCDERPWHALPDLPRAGAARSGAPPAYAPVHLPRRNPYDPEAIHHIVRPDRREARAFGGLAISFQSIGVVLADQLTISDRQTNRTWRVGGARPPLRAPRPPRAPTSPGLAGAPGGADRRSLQIVQHLASRPRPAPPTRLRGPPRPQTTIVRPCQIPCQRS